MANDSQTAEQVVLIATTPPTPWQTRSALLVIAILVLAFVASVPFASERLPRINSFIPAAQGIDFVANLVTAVLLFGQFGIIRSRALLVLASGYLYAALVLTSHALSYPGAFTPKGLFQIGFEATPWLYNFWRFGFAASVFAYAWMKEWAGARGEIRTSPVGAVWLSITGVVILVFALTWTLTAEESLLLPLLSDGLNFTPAANHVAEGALLISSIAFVWLAVRRTSVLDLWLMVAIFGMVIEQALDGFFVQTRFSFGYYSCRILAVTISTIVLTALLSETVRLYARLARANHRLQRERTSKLINVQAAIGATIHQLKQPLTVIGISSANAKRFLARTPPDTAAVQRIQNDIASATSHANEVLESMRTLFAGADQPYGPVNVNELMTESLQVMRHELEEYEIATSTQLAPDLPLIMGHKGQLEEVVLNIIRNSIEAMGTVTDKQRVLSVETKQQNETILILLQDTGPGIAQENITNIFEPFVTTKAEGTGLGLAIARMIIERHAGQISVRSDPGSGALFEISLPPR